MSEPPRFPLAQIAAMFAVAADLGFVLLLWFSSVPIVVKVSTTAVLLLLAVAIVFFYLGRRYEWKKSVRVTIRRP